MKPPRHPLITAILGSAILALGLAAPAQSAAPDDASPDRVSAVPSADDWLQRDAPGDFAKLHAVSASSPTDAWAVGFQQKPGGHSLGLTRHWDGTRWTTVESAHPLDYSYVWGVAAVSPTDAWAVGEMLGSAMILPFVEHWDGAKWTEVQFNRPGLGKLTAVSANGPDDVWMAGTRNDTNPFQYDRPLIVHWDGTSLHVVHAARPVPGHTVNLTSITAIASDDVWAVGSHGRHGQSYLPFLEHFDGTSWSIVSADEAQGTNSDTFGVDGSSSTDAWSVGWYLKDGESTISAYVQRWDGTAWTQSPAVTPGFASYLTSVSEVAPNDVWAVGTWTKTIRGSSSQPLIEHWDGSTWSVVAAPKSAHAATYPESVSMAGPGDGFAVGEQDKGAGARPYSIRWNGTDWIR